MSVITIYHNPNCGTSRNTLAMIRNAGIEPEVILYLETPPTRETLREILRRSDMNPRELMRSKEAIYTTLQLDDPKWSDEQLINHMLANPILINRPIVVTELGTRLCRPSELVLDLLSQKQRGAFTKEDGEVVIDAAGNRAT
jgi:arsenate reductase